MEMGIKNLQHAFVFLCLVFIFWLSACQKGIAPSSTPSVENTQKKDLSPQRVDIRGSILRSRYNQGQVILEVEGVPSQYSRYTRAYVLVLPSTQIVGVVLFSRTVLLQIKIIILVIYFFKIQWTFVTQS